MAQSIEQMMLTTLDNPYDPFEQFEEWNEFDQEKGYNTLSWLARIAETSLSMSPIEYAEATNEACKRIARLNPSGNLKIVRRNKIMTLEDSQDDD